MLLTDLRNLYALLYSIFIFLSALWSDLSYPHNLSFLIFGLGIFFIKNDSRRVSTLLHSFLDKMKPAALVKISAQVGDFYQDAQKAMNRDAVKGLWEKVSVHFLTHFEVS